MDRRLIACVLIIWTLFACTSWHVESGVEPARLIATQHPRVIRVTRTDRTRVVLERPAVIPGDTVTGLREGIPTRIAVADMTAVATQRIDVARSSVAVAGTLLVVGTIMMYATFKGTCLLGCH